MSENDSHQVHVFLAEDNQADVRLIELALAEHRLDCRLTLVTDGEQAMKAVACFGSTHPIPDIAMLDLNLPRQAGDTVMRSIREHRCCAHTPIIVMSSVQRSRDKNLAEQFGAVFFEKPATLSEFLMLGGLVKQLWMQQRGNGH